MIDPYKIRKDFPMYVNKVKMQNHNLVFLDNASTTFKPQCVLDAINQYYGFETSNSHRGDYDLCNHADELINSTRRLVAEFIGANPKECIFTTGTTNSLNLIAYGYARKYLNKDDEILISVEEHASNSLPWFEVAKEIGCRSFIANPVLVDELCDYARLTGIKELDIDFLSFSAHKMCGPTGVGVLYGKKELLEKMKPVFVGGGNNVTFSPEHTVTYLEVPYVFEAGTLNIEGILAFKAAIEYINKIGIESIHEYEQYLRKYAMKRMLEVEDIIIYNPNAEAGIITFNLKKVFAQDLGTYLNSKGIAVRTGQHCAKMLPLFLGTPATVRVSLYFYTTKEDIDLLVETLKTGGNFLDAYFA